MAYNNQRNNRKNNNYQQETSWKKIEEPLHIHYKEKSRLYLPEGIAHEEAKNFNRIASHQLRKILNQSKVCRDEAMYDFSSAKNHLFSLLPLAAYNAGRDKNLTVLYKFLVKHLNEKSIQSEEDIKVFDELFTSIIAYHKFEGGK